ncbi:MFS transporter [Cupriavidus basilensis]
MSKSTAGAIVTWTLVSSLVGAIGAGILADRYGRVRVLRWTIVVFAVACFLCGLASTPEQLLVFRMLQGLGFGGESSLCMVLVTEMIRNPAHRGKYLRLHRPQPFLRLGRAAAIAYAITFSLFPAETAWRVCFFPGHPAGAGGDLPAPQPGREPEVFIKSQAERAAGGAAVGCPFRMAATGAPGPPAAAGQDTLLCSLLSGGMLGAYYAIANLAANVPQDRARAFRVWHKFLFPRR